jgi:riboflavin synthase
VFTGITQGTFPVTLATRLPTLLRYEVHLGVLADGLALGASVSIDGVCQTVVAISGGRATFEVIAETLSRTTLADLAVGHEVSVECSARLGDEVGGHEVSGHVIGTAEVVGIDVEGDRYDLRLAAPAEWDKYLIPKGFIAIDGSSLTLGQKAVGIDRRCEFWLHLVPETLRKTNFGKRRLGDRVNVELEARTVAIVDTVERVLAERGTLGNEGPRA